MATRKRGVSYFAHFMCKVGLKRDTIPAENEATEWKMGGGTTSLLGQSAPKRMGSP